MQAVTLKKARQDLERLVEQVLDDVEPTIVVPESGRQDVLALLNEWTSWQEPRYLLANPTNAAHLRLSMADAQDGLSQERELRDT
jgi:antitoxin YefM